VLAIGSQILGRAVLGGHDRRDYRQEDVRHAISVVGQDSHLFSASIRDNVRLGRPGASDDDIERVSTWSTASSGSPGSQ
jgi:ABC-type multidrug transport system fused ATPase/permease subunit